MLKIQRTPRILARRDVANALDLATATDELSARSFVVGVAAPLDEIAHAQRADKRRGLEEGVVIERDPAIFHHAAAALGSIRLLGNCE